MTFFSSYVRVIVVVVGGRGGCQGGKGKVTGDNLEMAQVLAVASLAMPLHMQFLYDIREIWKPNKTEKVLTDYIVVGPISKDIHKDTGALLATQPGSPANETKSKCYATCLSVNKICIIKSFQAWSTVAGSQLHTSVVPFDPHLIISYAV